MTKKKFIGKLNHLYGEIVKKAKADGQDSDLVRSACLVRASDYKLPEGKTYEEAWNAIVGICGEIYGITA